jgi:hypothetical protein
MSIVTKLSSQNILNQYGYIIRVPLDFGFSQSIKPVDIMEPWSVDLKTEGAGNLYEENFQIFSERFVLLSTASGYTVACSGR